MEQSVTKQNVVILKSVRSNSFFGHVLRRLRQQCKLKEPRVFAQDTTCFLLFTRSRAYKARDEVWQNVVGQSKVDQSIGFLNLCLETPAQKGS